MVELFVRLFSVSPSTACELILNPSDVLPFHLTVTRNLLLSLLVFYVGFFCMALVNKDAVARRWTSPLPMQVPHPSAWCSIAIQLTNWSPDFQGFHDNSTPYPVCHEKGEATGAGHFGWCVLSRCMYWSVCVCACFDVNHFQTNESWWKIFANTRSWGQYFLLLFV